MKISKKPSHHSSFEETLYAHQGALKILALQLCRNLDDAHDLVQETIFKALKYQDKFKKDSNLKAWLNTILKNTFINDYRRKQKRNTFIDTSANLYFLDLPAQETDMQAELKFIRQDLNEAIATLAPDLKITFLLNAEGFKYHEIAEELQIPIGTVKTRIFVARRLLRDKLKVYALNYSPLKLVNE